MCERGMTLVEVTIAAAIAMAIGIALLSLPQGARLYAKQSSLQQFDAAFAYAQSLASTSGNGATLAFTAHALTIYSGGSASANAAMAPVSLSADVYEAVLGAPPFDIVLNGAGHANCPAGERSITLTFSDPQGGATRAIPCNAPVAGDAVTPGSVPQ